MDSQAVFLLFYFPTIHKKHFSNVLHNFFKPEKILKLFTSFILIKLRVKFIKVGKDIKQATYKNDLLIIEIKNVM